MTYLNGTDKSDILTATNADDLILGYKGNDTLYGGDGNDTFFKVDDINFVEMYWGTEGSDTMIGGNGNDNYLVDDVKDSIIENYGEGTDTVYTTLDSYSLPNNVENGWQIIRGDKNLYGNHLDNFLCGNCGWNFISGFDGNDTILGGGYGHDTLDGGNGNDSLYASVSECKLYGGQGDDILAGGYSNDTLGGGSGSDRYTGFYMNLQNNGSSLKIGFGHDVIQDYMDVNSAAPDTSGYDIVNLNEFSLDQIYLKGLDTDNNSNLDCLYIYCKEYGSIEIDHYFDNSTNTASDLQPGEGCIENIVLNQQVLHFEDVLNYLH